ncbi:hypothetical protein [Mucilaginibacter panaciglaebae]
MANIKFSYLYRDSGNYKKHGSVVFTDNGASSLLDIESSIRFKLIDELWFYANDWQVPTLFPDSFDPYNDPTWHEFESVKFTNEPANWVGPSV